VISISGNDVWRTSKTRIGTHDPTRDQTRPVSPCVVKGGVVVHVAVAVKVDVDD